MGKPEMYQCFRGIERTHWPKAGKLITNYAFRKRIKTGVVCVPFFPIFPHFTDPTYIYLDTLKMRKLLVPLY